ncbi:hypothetical protein [Bradyrhizobium sp.]|jgi:hypothetical protein|uniref:hypothetical protein n=1 Tax=Bradyrhizobium sp. TaxID=376 RepID=UPI003D0C1112
MSVAPSDCITERHLLLFGTIVHWFARYEVLMQRIMATVTGSHLADVMLLTKTLTPDQKRIALLDLLRHRAIPLDRFDAVYKYLTIPETFSLLLSDIEHSVWVAGKSSHSIQPDWILRPRPTIKPLHSGEDGRSEGFLEDYEDKVEYSLEQLRETAATLSENYQGFAAYCRSVGLLAENDAKVG